MCTVVYINFTENVTVKTAGNLLIFLLFFFCNIATITACTKPGPCQASWTESKPKLEKDPQARATNPDLSEADKEKLFRDHVKDLFEVTYCPQISSMF